MYFCFFKNINKQISLPILKLFWFQVFIDSHLAVIKQYSIICSRNAFEISDLIQVNAHKIVRLLLFKEALS